MRADADPYTRLFLDLGLEFIGAFGTP